MFSSIVRAIVLIYPFIKEVFYQTSPDRRFYFGQIIVICFVFFLGIFWMYTSFSERIDYMEQKNISYERQISDLQHQNSIVVTNYNNLERDYSEKVATVKTLRETLERCQKNRELEKYEYQRQLSQQECKHNLSPPPVLVQPKPVPNPVKNNNNTGKTTKPKKQERFTLD